MNINEEILRIKRLMEANDQNIITFFGDLKNSSLGCMIEIKDNENNLMGYTNLVSMSNAYELDSDIYRLNEKDEWCKKNCKKNYFNNDNTSYMYDLYVLDNYRGQGHASRLLDIVHDLAKKNGLDYVTLITNKDNHAAQNLYKKYGYEIHRSDDYKDFYFYSL